jgi:hypothetical protein
VARTAALALAVSLGSVAACGGDDDAVEYPTCAAGEVAVTGLVGDTLHVVKIAWRSYAFVNAIAGNGTFEADFDLNGPGALRLEWPELVANGAAVDARGRIETADAALKVGNCLDGSAFSGTMTVNEGGEGGRFILRDLHNPPYCGGSSVSGTLAGCFRNR